MEEGPGIPITLIFFFNISFTSSKPGSDMHGVPASVTKAIFLLSLKFDESYCVHGIDKPSSLFHNTRVTF